MEESIIVSTIQELIEVFTNKSVSYEEKSIVLSNFINTGNFFVYLDENLNIFNYIFTGLHLVAQYGDKDAVEDCLAYLEVMHDKEYVQRLMFLGDERQHTPIHRAAKNYNNIFGIFLQYLDYHYDKALLMTDYKGRTVLHLIICYGNVINLALVNHYLMDDLLFAWSSQDLYGYTPLSLLALSNDIDKVIFAISALQDKFALLSLIENHKGKPGLKILFSNKHKDIFEMFILGFGNSIRKMRQLDDLFIDYIVKKDLKIFLKLFLQIDLKGNYNSSAGLLKEATLRQGKGKNRAPIYNLGKILHYHHQENKALTFNIAKSVTDIKNYLKKTNKFSEKVAIEHISNYIFKYDISLYASNRSTLIDWNRNMSNVFFINGKSVFQIRFEEKYDISFELFISQQFNSRDTRALEEPVNDLLKRLRLELKFIDLNDLRNFLKNHVFHEVIDKSIVNKLADYALDHFHQGGIMHAIQSSLIDYFSYCNIILLMASKMRINLIPTEYGVIIEEKNIFNQYICVVDEELSVYPVNPTDGLDLYNRLLYPSLQYSAFFDEYKFRKEFYIESNSQIYFGLDSRGLNIGLLDAEIEIQEKKLFDYLNTPLTMEHEESKKDHEFQEEIQSSLSIDIDKEVSSALNFMLNIIVYTDLQEILQDYLQAEYLALNLSIESSEEICSRFIGWYENYFNQANYLALEVKIINCLAGYFYKISADYIDPCKYGEIDYESSSRREQCFKKSFELLTLLLGQELGLDSLEEDDVLVRTEYQPNIEEQKLNLLSLFALNKLNSSGSMLPEDDFVRYRDIDLTAQFNLIYFDDLSLVDLSDFLNYMCYLEMADYLYKNVSYDYAIVLYQRLLTIDDSLLSKHQTQKIMFRLCCMYFELNNFEMFDQELSRFYQSMRYKTLDIRVNEAYMFIFNLISEIDIGRLSVQAILIYIKRLQKIVNLSPRLNLLIEEMITPHKINYEKELISKPFLEKNKYINEFSRILNILPIGEKSLHCLLSHYISHRNSSTLFKRNHFLEEDIISLLETDLTEQDLYFQLNDIMERSSSEEDEELVFRHSSRRDSSLRLECLLEVFYNRYFEELDLSRSPSPTLPPYYLSSPLLCSPFEGDLETSFESISGSSGESSPKNT